MKLGVRLSFAAALVLLAVLVAPAFRPSQDTALSFPRVTNTPYWEPTADPSATVPVYTDPEDVAYPAPLDGKIGDSFVSSTKVEDIGEPWALFDVYWTAPDVLIIRIGVAGCVRNLSYSQACLTAEAGTYEIRPRPNQDWAYHPYRANSTYGFWTADGNASGAPDYQIYVPYELPRYLPVVLRNS